MRDGLVRDLRLKYDQRASGSERAVVDEEHVIGEDTAARVILDEAPLAASGVTISGTPAGGGSFSRVTGAPAAGQFRVMLHPQSQMPTGEVEFNAADADVAVDVSYSGTGSTLWARDFNRAMARLARIAGEQGIDQGSMTDTEYLQWCIDTQLERDPITGNFCKKVYLPAGTFVLTDTLNLLTLTGFRSIELIGAGSSYRNEINYGGTRIDATGFSDRPAIKIQGARRAIIRGISLKGAQWTYSTSTMALMSANPPNVDELDVANWPDPSLDASATSRYAPYQGIAIDPVAGEPFSSNIYLEDVWIGGFVVGVGIQLADHDGNGDFITAKKVAIEHCVYGWAIGNSQSRCVGLDSCDITNCHTALDGRTFGKQRGRFGGPLRNCTFERCVRIFNLKTDWNGPLELIGCYAESGVSFGYLESANATPLVVVGGTYEIGNPNWRASPEWHLDTQGTPAVFIGSDVSTIHGFATRTPIKSVGAKFRALRLDTEVTAGTDIQEKVNARRFMCEGLATSPQFVDPTSTFCMRDPIVGTGGSYVLMSDAQEFHGGPGAPNTMITRRIKRRTFGGVSLIPEFLSPFGAGVSRSALTFVDFSDPRACVLDTNGAFAGFVYPASKGDLVFDDGRLAYIITGISGDEWTLEAMHGYKSDGLGGFEFLNAVPDENTAGTLNWYPTRTYAPTAPLFGDITQGSPVVTNAGTAGGGNGPLSQIRVGDYLFTDSTYFLPFNRGTTVSAIDTEAGTITLSTNALYTQARIPLQWWMRAPES